jgi:hypothetical protein
MLFNYLDEIDREILKKYCYALLHIGIDFDRAEIQEALSYCYYRLEGVCQRVIEYWFWTQQNERKIDYPNALFLEALTNPQQWQPHNWQDTYLDYPEFKSPCQLWWEKAAIVWGEETRNNLVADVTETDFGFSYILFANGKTISLQQAENLDWQKLLEFAQTARGYR